MNLEKCGQMCAIKTLCFTKNSPGYSCSSGTKTKGLDCKTLVPVVKSRLGHDVKSLRSRWTRPGGATQGWQHPPKVAGRATKIITILKRLSPGGSKTSELPATFEHVQLIYKIS